MDETANVGSETEIATPESQAPQESASVETKQDRDWRAMRKAQEERDRKIRMQEDLIQRLMVEKTQAAPVTAPPDELDQIADDDYLQAGKFKSAIRKVEEKLANFDAKVEQGVQKALKAQAQSEALPRLIQKYPDFDDVVTTENLEILEQQDPELAASIASNKDDPYKMALQSYKFIKAMKLEEKAPASRREKETAKAIEKNANTVQSPLAFDKRPMAQAFKSSKEERKAIYEEMLGYAARSGGRY